MNDHAFQCAVCQHPRHHDRLAGQMWYGDPIGDCCAGAIEQCQRCSFYIQPHEVKEGDVNGNAICSDCLPKYDDSERCDGCGWIVTKPEDWHSHVADTGRQLRFCGRCTRKHQSVYGGNRTKVRKHPANVGHEKLDAELAERLRREA